MLIELCSKEVLWEKKCTYLIVLHQTGICFDFCSLVLKKGGFLNIDFSQNDFEYIYVYACNFILNSLKLYFSEKLRTKTKNKKYF